MDGIGDESPEGRVVRGGPWSLQAYVSLAVTHPDSGERRV